MSDYNHGRAIKLEPNLDLKDCLYKNCNQGGGGEGLKCMP